MPDATQLDTVLARVVRNTIYAPSPYSDEQLGRQVAMTFGEPGGLQELERSVPDYVWLPVARSARTRSWLTAHNYRIDIQTPRSFVAVRADLPRVETVPAVSTPCFPGP